MTGWRGGVVAVVASLALAGLVVALVHQDTSHPARAEGAGRVEVAPAPAEGSGGLAGAPAVAVGAGPSRGGEGEARVPEEARLCDAEPLPQQIRGVCYAHSWEDRGARGYGSETSAASLTELADLGVDWVSLTPFGFQERLDSTEVRRVRWASAENDGRIRAAVAAAHARGLRVMLKPHIWLSFNQWCGHIAHETPEAWAAWFDSYERFILHYAELAEETGADMLAVGVELDSTVREDPARWRQIVARVREAYGGPVVYAANWDAVDQVTIWDAVDYIGVQMFAPLAEHPDPTDAELRAAAAQWLTRYRVVSEQYERPLLLTEVGFKSINGAAVAPWTWPEHLPNQGTVVDQGEQAEAYCAILEVFGRDPAVAGMFWWKWFTDPNTTEEGAVGFSPRGKLAEDVLRAAYRREAGQR